MGLASDYVINAGDDCFVHLALLFTALLFSEIAVHGTVPNKLLNNTSANSQRKTG